MNTNKPKFQRLAEDVLVDGLLDSRKSRERISIQILSRLWLEQVLRVVLGGWNGVCEIAALVQTRHGGVTLIEHSRVVRADRVVPASRSHIRRIENHSERDLNVFIKKLSTTKPTITSHFKINLAF